jgi:hypothetical protein
MVWSTTRRGTRVRRAASAQELSELLAELKQRSGRSYESIGRKVNISRSTVQRYCTSHSVPAEFGSLERIARVCGADKDEIVRLFQLWKHAAAAGTDGTAPATGTAEQINAAETPTAPDAPAPSTPALADDPSSRPVPWLRKHRRYKFALLGAGLAALILTPTIAITGSRQAPPAPSRPAYPPTALMGSGSERCIDADNGKGRAGTILRIWDCSGAPDQKWVRYADATVRPLTSPDLCMEVAGDSWRDGDAIRLATCAGSPAQQFRLEPDPIRDLVNIRADKCVDVKNRDIANGATLQLWRCVGALNQKWEKR